MKLEFHTYSIPFKHPFSTATQTFENRTGIIAVLQKNGIRAMGEAAPLPGFSAETIEDVIRQIRDHQKEIREFLSNDLNLSALDSFLTQNPLKPSLQYCLYSLTLTYIAQKKELSQQRVISNEAKDSIALNGVLSLNKTAPVKEIDKLVNNGFQTIKIKAGADTHKLIETLQLIHADHPDVILRIDANRSWTFNKAKSVFNQIQNFNIEYCEEPLTEPSKNGLAKLRNHSSIPTALDESLVDTFSIKKAASFADVLIIKPMVHGHIVDTIQQIAASGGTKIIFTSSLDGAVGRLVTACLASAFGSKDSAHGLATGSMLTSDLWSDNQFIRNGKFHLPDAKKLRELMATDLSNITTQKLEG